MTAEPAESDSSGAVAAAGDPRLHAVLNVAAAGTAGVFALWLLSFMFDVVGAEAVGVWAFATSVAAFASVVDSGLAASVVRQAVSAHDRASVDGIRQVEAATTLYFVFGCIAVAIGLVLGAVMNAVLVLPPGLASQAPVVAILVGVDFAIVLATSPWLGILRGTGRFDLIFIASAVGACAAALAALALVPRFGLIGAALAQLLLHAIGRIVILGAVRQVAPWYQVLPRPATLAALRAVGRFSLPLFLSSIATQIGIGTDVIVVSALVGPAAAGFAALGARIPAFAVGVVIVALDAAFPWLVRQGGASSRMTTPLTTRLVESATLLGVVVFGVLATHAAPILRVWLGAADPIAVLFFLVYCAVWTINLPARALNLSLTASDRHHRVPLLVALEHTANLGLSLALVPVIGPAGAAVASLLAIIVSNAIGFPLLARRQLGVALSDLGRAAGLGAAAGAAAVATGLLAGRAVSDEPALEVAVAGFVSVLVGLGAQKAIIDVRGRPQSTS